MGFKMKMCPRCERYMTEKKITVQLFPKIQKLIWNCMCGYQEYAGQIFEKNKDKIHIIKRST